jgi:hypothetical protein
MPPRRGLAAAIVAALFSITACVPSPRLAVPTEAPVPHLAATESPPLEIGDPEKATPENPFTSDAVIPCRDDEDRAQARKAIESLGAEIVSFDESSTPAALDKARRSLQALLDTPCFELAKADLREPLEFDSGVALRNWWWEGGGESALARRVGTDDDDRYPSITLPGQPLPSLLLRGHETHPLAPLLCAVDDHACGRDTRGWVRRSTRGFENERRLTDAAECEKNLLNEEPEQRWSTLIECEMQNAPTETALPLGRFRAMTEGYFVVTQPPSNCGSVEVYDLASGTVIRSSSCSRTDVLIGRVPLASLREAAWVMALSAYAKDHVRQQTSFTIPDRVVPGRPRDVGEQRRLHGLSYRRGPQPAWTWYRRSGGKMVAQVTGTTPGSTAYVAGRYALELLRIADDSFVEGCAPAFSSAALAAVPWKETGPMVTEKLNLGFDFQSPDLDAARAAILRAKPPAKCTEPL